MHLTGRCKLFRSRDGAAQARHLGDLQPEPVGHGLRWKLGAHQAVHRPSPGQRGTLQGERAAAMRIYAMRPSALSVMASTALSRWVQSWKCQATAAKTTSWSRTPSNTPGSASRCGPHLLRVTIFANCAMDHLTGSDSKQHGIDDASLVGVDGLRGSKVFVLSAETSHNHPQPAQECSPCGRP